MPEVSIIIINYNTFNLTCNCIRSVIDKTTAIGYEIILVDNASVECDAALFLKEFSSIKLVKSATNIGFARGNNLGIQHAGGEYILLLNSDTELVENSVKFIYDKCLLLPDVGAATIKVVYPDGKPQSAGDYFPDIGIRLFKTSKASKPPLDYDQDFIADWIWGTFYFFPKKNLAYMGGKLSETFFMYAEDMEWGLLFSKAGLKNYYFSQSHIIHYLSQSPIKGSKVKMLKKSHLKFVRKYYGIFNYFIEAMSWNMHYIIKKIKQ